MNGGRYLPRRKAASEISTTLTNTEITNNYYYYSTIASFYHIWSRERAKYETVIHCSVPV